MSETTAETPAWECHCGCHRTPRVMMHVTACCNNCFSCKRRIRDKSRILCPDCADKPLSLETAVAVLNRYRHDGTDRWYIRDPELGWVEKETDMYSTRSAFEAVAIAEKYLRDRCV